MAEVKIQVYDPNAAAGTNPWSWRHLSEFTLSGTLAERPVAGQAGRRYYVTDAGQQRICHDNGTSWDDIVQHTNYMMGSPIAGGGAASDGIDGEDGMPGTPGPAGSPGQAGIAGPPGNDGLDGDDGAVGPPGAAGTAGAAGAAGAPGAPGASGPAGIPGPPGLDAEDEIPWIVPGPAGATGPQGAPGGAGAQPYAIGSVSVATGNYLLLARRLILTGSQRVTLAGNATLRVT